METPDRTRRSGLRKGFLPSPRRDIPFRPGPASSRSRGNIPRPLILWAIQPGPKGFYCLPAAGVSAAGGPVEPSCGPECRADWPGRWRCRCRRSGRSGLRARYSRQASSRGRNALACPGLDPTPGKRSGHAIAAHSGSDGTRRNDKRRLTPVLQACSLRVGRSRPDLLHRQRKRYPPRQPRRNGRNPPQTRGN